MASTGNKKSTAAKKSTTKKSSSGKKTSNSKSKKNKQLTLSDIINRREFFSTLIFVIGIIMILLLMAGAEGTLWNNVHTFYIAVFGMAGYYLPFAVLFLGIINVLNKQKPVFRHKVFELFILALLLNGMVYINAFVPAHESMDFSEGIATVFDEIMTHTAGVYSNGGLSGAVIGGALYLISGSRVIADILSLIFIFADLMFLFGITLFRVFSQLEKPAQKVGEYTGERLENVKTDYERMRKERAENKEKRKSQGTVNPALVVGDFYKNNPDAVGNSDRSESRSKGKNAKQSADTEQTAEIHSIFDIPKKEDNPVITAEKSESNEQNEKKAEIFDFSSIKTKNREISSDECKGVQLDGKPESEKNVKVDPLTESEKNAIHNELSEALDTKPVAEYVKPRIEFLKLPDFGSKNYDTAELKNNGEKLIAALQSFNVQASIVDVVPGPTVTRYELSPAPGVKISKFVGLSDDLALHMAAPAGLRIEAPIPNKAAIGIEIPNKNKVTVTFREVIDNDKFRNSKSKLNVALGKDISGDIIFSDIAKMPHLLVAGTTGSGKSVCLNTMIMSILYNASPDEVKLILIDPKQVEFGIYNGLPHLLVPVVSDPRKASGALAWAVTEMLSRYKTLNANGVRDIGAYNSLCETNEELTKMSQVVIFIDELSDLMTVAPAEVEDSIQRLAQMARAAGMHLVVATQRPSVDVITGVIKANIPSRIALTVKSQIDSRTIIDSAGAEKLMGYGDMLYYPVGIPKPIRVQGAYLSDKEIENVVEFIKANGTAVYDDAVQQEIEKQAASEKKKGASSGDDGDSSKLDKNDDLLMRAIELFVSAPEKASISALQRHLSLGFAKAGRLMDTLEEKGIVGPTEGSKPRKVLITKAQWYEMNAMSGDVTGESIPQTQDDGFEEITTEENNNE